jgi:hypothetical protein
MPKIPENQLFVDLVTDQTATLLNQHWPDVELCHNSHHANPVAEAIWLHDIQIALVSSQQLHNPAFLHQHYTRKFLNQLAELLKTQFPHLLKRANNSPHPHDHQNNSSTSPHHPPQK